MIKTAMTAALTFLALDFLWLGVIANKLYINQFGSMLRLNNGGIQALWLPAIIVYLALIGGILYFVIPKADGDILHAFIVGAAYGFVTYATYDFTNLAVMANWPVMITIVDVVWGMFICATTSAISMWVHNL